MQETIVIIVVCITTAFVIYKTYKQITSKKQNGCNCNGCNKCSLKK